MSGPPVFRLTEQSNTNNPVYLYTDSMRPVIKGQTRETETLPIHNQGRPQVEVAGLDAGDYLFAGIWIGADAKTLRDRLETNYINDETVGQVAIQALDASGNAVASPFNGNYALDGRSETRQPAAKKETAWEYELVVSEEG